MPVSTGQAITGWRVFDVEGDKVTLISAGNPEDYNQILGESYQNEYILTGNVSSSWTNGITESEKYQKRDWSEYVNKSQKAESAQTLTKDRLDNWYAKYTNTLNADIYELSTFQKIYQAPYIKYQNMVENNSLCWLSVAYNTHSMYIIHSEGRRLGLHSAGAYGVRILVTLSLEAKFIPQKIGTKTVTGGNMAQYGGDQTYNVWGIR